MSNRESLPKMTNRTEFNKTLGQDKPRWAGSAANKVFS